MTGILGVPRGVEAGVTKLNMGFVFATAWTGCAGVVVADTLIHGEAPLPSDLEARLGVNPAQAASNESCDR